ncbi:MAG: alpha/beta fold hydrolase [Pseudomonadota bacterium]
MKAQADQLQQKIAIRAQADAASPDSGQAGGGQTQQQITKAIDIEARRRLGQFFSGVERYRRADYRRDLADPPVIWAEGATRLLDYGTDPKAKPILVVPSLINRGYILDLTESTSLMRWLAGQGFRPLMVDWGTPGPLEHDFTLTDYVAGRLERTLDAARRITRQSSLPVLGYCMGGMLAAALAWRRPLDVHSLVLLATPWSFHAMGAPAARRVAAAYEAIAPFVDQWGALPVDAIQSLFASLDPLLVPRKFVNFAGLDSSDEDQVDQFEAFVALEDWLNDGIPLPAKVAHECLRGWYGRNDPARGNWRIAGLPVTPQSIEAPSLVVIPDHDRIVPPASAQALASLIPKAEPLPVSLGHVGLVVGSSAQAKVWEPIASWLRSLG